MKKSSRDGLKEKSKKPTGGKALNCLDALAGMILDGINEAIAIIDVRDYTLVGANKAFFQEIGRSESEILGKPCYAVIYQRSSPCGQEGDRLCPLTATLADERHQTTEHIIHAADGTTRHIVISVAPIRDKAGRIVQAVRTSRDITSRKELEISLEHERKLLQQANASLEKAFKELKQTQSQIVQQEKMASIGQLAAGVAHEINNPMGFISSNLSSLAKYMKKISAYLAFQEKVLAAAAQPAALAERDAERGKMKIDFLLEDIPSLIAESLDGAKRVKNIVQNLKSFSRIDSGKITDVAINDCLEVTLDIVWNELKYKAVVSKEYGELPTIRGSAQQLNQVFMNILMNAIQAIDVKGTIRIRTWAEADKVCISIADDGCGIDSRHLPHIFEPFFTTKEVGKGTGLGMSIAYDIIKKHHGTIHVESTKGRGTTFIIDLPT